MFAMLKVFLVLFALPLAAIGGIAAYDYDVADDEEFGTTTPIDGDGGSGSRRQNVVFFLIVFGFVGTLSCCICGATAMAFYRLRRSCPTFGRCVCRESSDERNDELREREKEMAREEGETFRKYHSCKQSFTPWYATPPHENSDRDREFNVRTDFESVYSIYRV